MFVKLDPRIIEPFYKKFIWPFLMLMGILLIGTLGYWLLDDRQHPILVAVKTLKSWHYNPPKTYALSSGDILILLTSGTERDQLRKDLKGLK